MDKTSGQYVFSGLSKVIYGPGSVRHLGDEMTALGARRVLLVTGKTLGASPLFRRVQDSLGDLFVGAFKEASEHTPARKADILAAEIRRLDADGVVSFGGSSASDLSKVAIGAVLSGRPARDLVTDDFAKTVKLGEGKRFVRHIAVPTTLSAGEYNPAAAITDEAGHKRAVISREIQVDVIVNDAELTMATPDALWAGTGLRLFDHIIEAFYSGFSQSFTDALATKALQLLMAHLPASLTTSGDEKSFHRGQCLSAALLGNYAAVNTQYGLSHAVGHKIGPMWDIPHGATSAIALPHAARLMAVATPERFGALASAMGVAFDADNPGAGAQSCVERIAAFVNQFGLDTTLQAYGVRLDQIDAVVSAIHYEINDLGAVGVPIDEQLVRDLLAGMHGAGVAS